MLHYVDAGDSELIQLAYNSRECQLPNKTSSSPHWFIINKAVSGSVTGTAGWSEEKKTRRRANPGR